jgi:hypothetical protein
MKFSDLQRLQRREGITVTSADDRIEQLERRLHTITEDRDALRAELDALKAWKEEVDKQEPLGVMSALGQTVLNLDGVGVKYVEPGTLLYTNPVPAQSFADAYQGAMEEVAIWKRRALEAEELNRKFIAEINGPTHMGEPVPASTPDEHAAFRSWFLGEQGVAYDGMWAFAKAAWMARAALAAAPKPDGKP